MTGDEMRTALTELGWKQADLCRRVQVSANTVSAWATSGPPAWVGEYLGVLLGLERLHRAHIRPAKPAPAPPPAPAERERRLHRAANLARKLKDPDLFREGGTG